MLSQTGGRTLIRFDSKYKIEWGWGALCLPHVCRYSQRPEEDGGSPKAEVLGSYELPSMGQVLNLGPLKE